MAPTDCRSSRGHCELVSVTYQTLSICTQSGKSVIVTRPTEGSILWIAFAYIHSVRQLHPPLNMEHSMKLASIFPVIVMCAFLAAFQTSDAQATPTHLSASKLVVSKIAMSTWPATHQATWDFWSILRQYLHKNSYGTYGPRVFLCRVRSCPSESASPDSWRGEASERMSASSVSVDNNATRNHRHLWLRVTSECPVRRLWSAPSFRHVHGSPPVDMGVLILSS